MLLSIDTTFLKIKIKEGKKYAENLQTLKKKIDEPLIIILSLNTIAHTVGSILVGVQAKILYSSMSENSDFYFLGILMKEDLLVGVVSTIMTILILVVSEIIPKTLGANYWSSLAKFTSIFLSSLIPLFKYSGVLWILQSFTRILGKSKQDTRIKREDFSTMAEIAEEEGIIEEKESDFIKNMVKFRNLINKKSDLKLSEIKRKIIITDYNSKIPFLFDKLLKEREHISLVKDKKGAIKGLVTLEDILETILGLEIVDETDKVEDLQAFAKKYNGN